MNDCTEMNLLSSNPLIQYGNYWGIFSDYRRKKEYLNLTEKVAQIIHAFYRRFNRSTIQFVFLFICSACCEYQSLLTGFI